MKVTELKSLGAARFQAKQYKEAIIKYSDAIEITKLYLHLVDRDPNLKLKLT